MTNDAVNTKNNLALFAKVFDFLSQLDAEQINDLLSGKADLCLNTQIDKQIGDLISKKLETLDKKFETMLDERFGLKNINGTSKVENKAEAPRRGRPLGSNAKAKKSAEANKIPSLDFEAVASEIRSIDSKEGLEKYFADKSLKIGPLKSLASKHFGVPGANRMSTVALMEAIIESVLK